MFSLRVCLQWRVGARGCVLGWHRRRRPAGSESCVRFPLLFPLKPSARTARTHTHARSGGAARTAASQRCVDAESRAGALCSCAPACLYNVRDDPSETVDVYSQVRLLHSVCALCAPCPHPAAVCAGVRERLDSMMCSMRTLQRGSRTASDLWAQQRRLRARTGMTQPALSLRSARHRTRRDFLSQSKSAEGLPAVRGPGLIRTGSLSGKDASRMLKSPWKFDPEGLGPKRQGGFRSCRVCYLARVQGL
jgi:hypothetical protein